MLFSGRKTTISDKSGAKSSYPLRKGRKAFAEGIVHFCCREGGASRQIMKDQTFPEKIQALHFLAMQSGIFKFLGPRSSETSGVQLVHPDKHLRIRLEG